MAFLQVILSSTQHVNKGRDYSQFKWMNGDGLITSSGEFPVIGGYFCKLALNLSMNSRRHVARGQEAVESIF